MEHTEELQQLQSTHQRLEMQCRQLRLAAGMTFMLALMISMAFPLALLLLFLIWVQESIWRADIVRITDRSRRLLSGTEAVSYAQWKTEKIDFQAVQTQAMQPKVVFIYLLLFGLEMTLFGMGMWPI